MAANVDLASSFLISKVLLGETFFFPLLLSQLHSLLEGDENALISTSLSFPPRSFLNSVLRFLLGAAIAAMKRKEENADRKRKKKRE